MKYVAIIADGMADEPVFGENGATPLQLAYTPMLDCLAKRAEIGMVKTIPDGMESGSDVANLAILGYDPKEYPMGRASLEALGLGIPLKENEIVYRCNIVTLSSTKYYEKSKMLDHTAGQIATQDAKKIMEKMKNVFDSKAYRYYTETSYRHLLVGEQGDVVQLVPPHNILGEEIGKYLPSDVVLREMMQQSYERLKFCPDGLQRQKYKFSTVPSLWLWGGGKRVFLPSFEKKFHQKAAMISAVAVLKGLARAMDITNLSAKGATGTFYTNYESKAQRATKALLEESYDFVYLHIEAPDEASHQGDWKRKKQAIEKIDQKVVKVIYDNLKNTGERFRLLILPDHGTATRTRRHLREEVPYLLWDSQELLGISEAYNEKQAKTKGVHIDGIHLLEHMFL